ncbi:MAG: glutathione S-transferase family protein [Gammaproteobacteria bacterium]|nr:glutathione S-transferase family protein [Gammaproteobacteria bacterium]MBU1506365.1 glutathione S-transferase family protein [Gammaproteobacteria bacterium]MBU2123356.1 glutathione S-transferase family protein [Gammaproteobacteria bacterium]MBU2169685.1 glutathione S-transferase family protein [Gammaproteobacteria bacterium]MBU2201390.1 glutathione S-transferase family protein [Gammaproteobacteria bacterium]
MSIVLYWHPMSSATPIACALTELGVPHDRVKIDIRTGEQRRPEYLALNPNGKVPTLTVDGAPMFEALAIHLWLGHRFGIEQGLWPAAGTPEALQALSWCTWSYVTYGAVVTRLFLATQGEEALRSPVQVEAAVRGLNEHLALLDARLAKHPWMLGAEYSLVDLVVGSVVGYSVYLGAPVQAHPHVQAWLTRVQSRPAMQIDA